MFHGSGENAAQNPVPADGCPGPCFGRSALCVVILPSIFLPTPCPGPKLSTRECSGQLPGLDGALREFSIPVPGPVVSSLVAPASSSGRPAPAAPNPVLGAAVWGPDGRGRRSHLRLCQRPGWSKARVAGLLCPPPRHAAAAGLMEREKPWGLLDSSPLLGPFTGSSSCELPVGGRAMWSSTQNRGGGERQRPVFQPASLPLACTPHGVRGPRSAPAVTGCVGHQTRRRVTRSGGGWPAADLDTSLCHAPF